MVRLPRILSLTFAALLCLAGCAAPPWFSRSNSSKTDSSQNPAANAQQPPPGAPANTPGNPNSAQRAATPGANDGASPQSMQAIIAELQQLGALDAQSQ